MIAVGSDIASTISPSLVAFVVLILMAFSIVGAVIVSQRPNNGLGWLFVIGGLLIGAEFLSVLYGYRALATDPGSLPGGRVAAWIEDVVQLLAAGLLTAFLFLLFPEGRLRTRAERRSALVVLVGIGLTMLSGFIESDIQGYVDVPAPLGFGVSSTFSLALQAAGYAVFLAGLIASIALLVGRLRRATGRERDQLRLLVWAAVVGVTLLIPASALPASAINVSQSLVYAIGGLGLLLIPVSVGVAILRLQLLDIDLVIRRTVVVALIGAFITLVYVGVVVGVGALVGSSGNVVLSAVAAAVVAIAFQPVRRWAQRLANRFVYGPRATPYEVLHEFSERVAGSYGTEDILPRMAAILGQGTGAERAQVWLRLGTELRPAAVWPDGVRATAPVTMRGEVPPPIRGVTHVVAVRDGGEVLGALSITKDASDPVSQTEEKLVSDLALQAGLVMRNVRLLEDLRASRGRLVAAQDHERRKLERNIHDGAQQQLVALAVKARLAGSMVGKDEGRERALLEEIAADTQETLESLRDLARGIYPPLLADKGLAAALKAQSRKVPVPVELDADGIGRYAPEIEATVYFCVLEALQNAAKYSDASRVTVALEGSTGSVGFEVADDGRGFDPASTPRGAGLQNMGDRIEAVGGELQIRSALGEGTSLTARIPVVVHEDP